jgi:phage-Barnase-EndoU-ColicinE5/D-RelE like nuclease3
MKKEIKELVEFALSDELNKHKVISIGTVTKKQAEIIKKITGIEMYGCVRIIDTSAIRHILRNHGFTKQEESRGQIAVTIDDFENIPHYITNASKIEYIGKNRIKQDSFQYTTEEDGTIIIIEGVIINKRGNKMQIETMYKKKKKQP